MAPADRLTLPATALVDLPRLQDMAPAMATVDLHHLPVTGLADLHHHLPVTGLADLHHHLPVTGLVDLHHHLPVTGLEDLHHLPATGLVDLHHLLVTGPVDLRRLAMVPVGLPLHLPDTVPVDPPIPPATIPVDHLHLVMVPVDLPLHLATVLAAHLRRRLVVLPLNLVMDHHRRLVALLHLEAMERIASKIYLSKVRQYSTQPWGGPG